MSKKRIIAIAGVALLAGLAFIENATRSVGIQPATVADVTSISPDAGPDLWTLNVTLRDGTEAQIETQTIRPTQAVGDPVCVRIHQRSWAAPKYILSTDTAC